MTGRNALVLGGTGDIGRAVLDRLRAEGLRALGAAHDIDATRGDGLHVDLREEASVISLFERVDRELGPLHVLVNCAGIGLFRSIEETSARDWRETLEVNLTGAFLCAREAFKRMKARGGGRIIQIGSVSDHLTLPMNAAYAASKHGVRALTGVLNEEGQSCSVRATLVSLGAVYTSLWKSHPEFNPADMLSVQDVAESICDIARKPLSVRIDELRLLPPKGVL